MEEFVLSDFTKKKVNKIYKKYLNTDKKIIIYCAGELTDTLLRSYPELLKLNIIGITDSNTEKTGN